MRDVSDPGLDDLWTCASQEALDRTAALARQGLKASLAILSSFEDQRRILRSVDGLAAHFPPEELCAAVFDAGEPKVMSGANPFLGVAITRGSGEAIGTLCVVDNAERIWSDDEVDFLVGIGSTLVDQIELGHQLRTQTIGGPLQPPQPTPHQVFATADKIRILIADDLDLNRKLIADMLAIDGHIVDCVSDGAAAVTAAQQSVYDLILMDMIMPGMDGPTAAAAIRALPAPACNVPILALTANCGKEQLDSCLAAGMNATLTKPMTIEDLSNAVSNWVGRRSEAA